MCIYVKIYPLMYEYICVCLYVYIYIYIYICIQIYTCMCIYIYMYIYIYIYIYIWPGVSCPGRQPPGPPPLGGIVRVSCISLDIVECIYHRRHRLEEKNGAEMGTEKLETNLRNYPGHENTQREHSTVHVVGDHIDQKNQFEFI